jgi:hypothetical protein
LLLLGIPVTFPRDFSKPLEVRSVFATNPRTPPIPESPRIELEILSLIEKTSLNPSRPLRKSN